MIDAKPVTGLHTPIANIKPNAATVSASQGFAGSVGQDVEIACEEGVGVGAAQRIVMEDA